VGFILKFIAAYYAIVQNLCNLNVRYLSKFKNYKGILNSSVHYAIVICAAAIQDSKDIKSYKYISIYGKSDAFPRMDFGLCPI
jgi:hypothetical protein